MTQTAIEAPPATRRQWLGLAVLALPTLLSAMDFSVLFLALPRLAADVRPSGTQLLWITDIYGFMVAGFLVTMGALGNRIGQRRLLTAGAVAFGLASAAAAYSVSADMLIAARALLGIAGATLMPSTLGLISTMFRRPAQRTTAVSLWAACLLAGTAIGPVVGGVLLQFFWWGSVFLIGLPVMAVLVIAAPVLLPEHREPGARARPPAAAERGGWLSQRGPVPGRDAAGHLQPEDPGPVGPDRPGDPRPGRQAWPSARCSCAASGRRTARCSTCACSGTAPSPPPWASCSPPGPSRRDRLPVLAVPAAGGGPVAAARRVVVPAGPPGEMACSLLCPILVRRIRPGYVIGGGLVVSRDRVLGSDPGSGWPRGGGRGGRRRHRLRGRDPGLGGGHRPDHRFGAAPGRRVGVLGVRDRQRAWLRARRRRHRQRRSRRLPPPDRPRHSRRRPGPCRRGRAR